MRCSSCVRPPRWPLHSSTACARAASTSVRHWGAMAAAWRPGRARLRCRRPTCRWRARPLPGSVAAQAQSQVRGVLFAPIAPLHSMMRACADVIATSFSIACMPDSCIARALSRFLQAPSPGMLQELLRCTSTAHQQQVMASSRTAATTLCWVCLAMGAAAAQRRAHVSASACSAAAAAQAGASPLAGRRRALLRGPLQRASLVVGLATRQQLRQLSSAVWLLRSLRQSTMRPKFGSEAACSPRRPGLQQAMPAGSSCMVMLQTFVAAAAAVGGVAVRRRMWAPRSGGRSGKHPGGCGWRDGMRGVGGMSMPHHEQHIAHPCQQHQCARWARMEYQHTRVARGELYFAHSWHVWPQCRLYRKGWFSDAEEDELSAATAPPPPTSRRLGSSDHLPTKWVPWQHQQQQAAGRAGTAFHFPVMSADGQARAAPGAANDAARRSEGLLPTRLQQGPAGSLAERALLMDSLGPEGRLIGSHGAGERGQGDASQVPSMRTERPKGEHLAPQPTAAHAWQQEQQRQPTAQLSQLPPSSRARSASAPRAATRSRPAPRGLLSRDDLQAQHVSEAVHRERLEAMLAGLPARAASGVLRLWKRQARRCDAVLCRSMRA